MSGTKIDSEPWLTVLAETGFHMHNQNARTKLFMRSLFMRNFYNESHLRFYVIIQAFDAVSKYIR